MILSLEVTIVPGGLTAGYSVGSQLDDGSKFVVPVSAVFRKWYFPAPFSILPVTSAVSVS